MAGGLGADCRRPDGQDKQGDEGGDDAPPCGGCERQGAHEKQEQLEAMRAVSGEERCPDRKCAENAEDTGGLAEGIAAQEEVVGAERCREAGQPMVLIDRVREFAAGARADDEGRRAEQQRSG